MDKSTPLYDWVNKCLENVHPTVAVRGVDQKNDN